METGKKLKTWERTAVTNLLRNGPSGTYYARVKVRGKQKWRSLDTKVFSVAKLRLADAEREIRAKAITESTTRAGETTAARCIAILRERQQSSTSSSSHHKTRQGTALKAVLKTWPDLPERDIRRIPEKELRDWAERALSRGTGFVPIGGKQPAKKGMSASSFNKTLDALRGIFEVAKELGLIYENPADKIERAPVPKKRLQLPTTAQFHAIVSSVSGAGARQSRDCADLIRGLAFTGLRVSEAAELRWSHIDFPRGVFTAPGTKSDSSHRTIPLFPPFRTLLDELHGRRAGAVDGPIFGVKECQKSLAAGCRAVGVKKMTHHDLRHLFATRCIESGVDIPTVSKWLGHADGGALAMRTYGHLRQEHSLAAAAKVNFD